MENEDFDYVWLCSENRLILQSIMEDSIFYLMEQLLIDNENFKDDKDLADFHDFWDICRYDPNSFTFIDLIKGIIPLSLSQKIRKFTKKCSTEKIIIGLRNYILTQSLERIWKPRCNFVKQLEKDFKLTKKFKKDHVNTMPFYDVRRKGNADNRDIELLGLRHLIYYGGNILEYYNTHVD